MLERVLEPEVMDTAEEAADYDAMDHSAVNALFVDDLIAFSDNFLPQERWLDVGTGTGQILVELGRRRADAHVLGIDLAEEMLRVARTNLVAAGLGERMLLEVVDAKRLPYAGSTFGGVMSNSIIHHLPEPVRALEQMVRVLKPGGALFVRDLCRPETDDDVERLVALHAAEASSSQKQLFRQSLYAALTVDEMAGLARQCGIAASAVQLTSDRHWTLAWRKPSA